VTQNRATPNQTELKTPYQRILAASYYGVLGVHPAASVREIRQAYRDLSKQYHPDTTSLPPAIATAKFHQLNEAYATLNNPEQRLIYDRKIGYSRVAVVQPTPTWQTGTMQGRYKPTQSNAYLDPTDRPLSAGEVFALFILGLTFAACLALAIVIGLTKGEAIFQTATVANPTISPPDLPTLTTQPAVATETAPRIVAPEVEPPATLKGGTAP
jgi:hypothetical protein